MDWPRSNFEHFIKMFSLTAVIDAGMVEESVVMSDHRKIENKCEEELDGVEIQLLPSHPTCKEAS